MVINLAEAQFTNDMLQLKLPSEGIITFNCVNESVQKRLSEKEIDIKDVNRINIQISLTLAGQSFYSNCSSIIGFQDFMTKIVTDFEELKGQILTLDNMRKCKVVVDEV